MIESGLPDKLQIVIQASSRSWSGGRDLCVNEVDGQAAIVHLVAKLRQWFPSAALVIAAPEFDRDGCLPELLRAYADHVSFVFAHDASPLRRMLLAAQEFKLGFLRINGLNMFVQQADLQRMWALAREQSPACIKFPDAYPAQLTFDYYGKAELAELAAELVDGDPAHVHPKYALFERHSNRCVTLDPVPPQDAQLQRYREQARSLYVEARDEMNAQALAVGDTLGFHYELALAWLKPEDRVLDIACGGYRGPQRLAQKCAAVVAADIDAAVIEACRCRDSAESQSNLSFVVADVTKLAFADQSFDVVTSFETIEHVDADAYFSEIARVLKPEGLLVLSTPQNCLGHIPINPQHRVEYGLDELLALVGQQPFEVVQIQGIKQGRVIVEGEQSGSNTFMVLRRKP